MGGANGTDIQVIGHFFVYSPKRHTQGGLIILQLMNSCTNLLYTGEATRILDIITHLAAARSAAPAHPQFPVHLSLRSLHCFEETEFWSCGQLISCLSSRRDAAPLSLEL